MKTVFRLKKGSTILVLSTISIFGFSEQGVMQHPSTTDLKTSAREIPLVYDAENSVAPFEVSLPSFEKLPVMETLPDPFCLVRR